MRICWFSLGVALLAGCSPLLETPSALVVADGEVRPEQEPPTRSDPAVPVLPTAVPSGSKAMDLPRAVSRVIDGKTFKLVTFDSRSHRLQVVDFRNGPQDGETAESVALGRHGLAAVNGGFFTPEGGPLGLVVADGTVRGLWNGASSLGSAVWSESSGGAMSIRRRGSLSPVSARTMRELLQAGPLLVENRNMVSGLDAEKTSARSFVLWDGGTRWAIGHCSPSSLRETARLLANKPPVPWRVYCAINLDGGRSADLWAASSLPGGPFSERSFLNRPVRNYLVLVAR